MRPGRSRSLAVGSKLTAGSVIRRSDSSRRCRKNTRGIAGLEHGGTASRSAGVRGMKRPVRDRLNRGWVRKRPRLRIH